MDVGNARRMSHSSIQTAHVRPFVCEGPTERKTVLDQIHLSTPWACESDINQALVIHNNNILETVKFLKVEKLYRYQLYH